MLRSIVIVGASLAGVRAAETLRSAGYDAHLVLVGAEPHAPYDRPPLSKEVLRGEWGPERAALRRDGFADLSLELLLGRRAVSLDRQQRIVALDDGSSLPYEGLVIATGAEVRRLAGLDDTLAGVHVLRTLDDAVGLRDDLQRGPRVAIVGAGFVGLEVAASCRARGLDVTIVEPQPEPLASLLGDTMGGFFAGLHRDHGVRVRTGVAVAAIEGGTRVERIRLSDGSVIEADVAVVGIGVRPATGWLAGSGLEIADGVIADACCRAADDVVVAGDVARWLHPLYQRHIRVEHWMNAAEQGAAAARALLAGSAAMPYDSVPSFWSDQYDCKVQFAGLAEPGARVEIVAGDTAARRFVALYGLGDRLVGVLAVRRAAQFIRYSELLARGARFEDALAQAR